MDDPLQEAQSRLQRYTVIDGLHEIGAAVIFALTAVWVWTERLSDLPRFGRHAISIGFGPMIWVGIWAEGLIVKAIRRRLTYPRAGFAEKRRPTRPRALLVGLLAALLAAVVAYSVVRLHVPDRWILVLPGLGMCLFWQIGSRSGLPRFHALGALSVSGGVTLYRFLHA